MEISKIGEFGLIDRLTKDIKPQNESTKYGVGDDCAVLHYPDSEVLVTTDMLMEGVHFDLTYISLQHLGYKSAMVNISDIFAMNGTPRQITVSMAPKVTSNPSAGMAPLTVTFDARASSDPSRETIPSDNFYRYYRDEN